MTYPLPQKTPNNLFQNSQSHETHKFEVGMKLEAVSPVDRRSICPATVVKVFDDKYFLVMIDEEFRNGDVDESKIFKDEKQTWLCNVDHPLIFPIGYAQRNDIT